MDKQITLQPEIQKCLEFLIDVAMDSKIYAQAIMPGYGFFEEYAVRMAAGRQIGLTTSMMNILHKGRFKSLWIIRNNKRIADHLQKKAYALGFNDDDIYFTLDSYFPSKKKDWAIPSCLQNVDFVVIESGPWVDLPKWAKEAIGARVQSRCLLVELG